MRVPRREWFGWFCAAMRMLLAPVLGRSLSTRQQAHTEALCHLLLTPEEMETGAALGARWRLFCCTYCTVRLALHTAEHIIKKFACFSSRSRTDQRRGRWMPLSGSQPHPWALVRSLSLFCRRPRGHRCLTNPDLMAFCTTVTCCTLMRIF